MTEDESFNSDQKLLKRFTYTYDEAGNKTENSRYSSEGKSDRKISYKYDNRRNVSEEISVSADGSTVSSVYTYEYDSRDNWIRKIKLTDKKPESIVEREIGYY